MRFVLTDYVTSNNNVEADCSQLSNRFLVLNENTIRKMPINAYGLKILLRTITVYLWEIFIFHLIIK